MVFRSKVDLSLIWLVRVPVLAAIILSGVLAVRQPGGLSISIVALLLVAYAVVEWILGSTYYMVDQDFLRIRSGPFRSRMLISEIQSISRSLDRLEIRDGNGRTVYVSPREDEEFVEALRSVNGEIELVNQ